MRSKQVCTYLKFTYNFNVIEKMTFKAKFYGQLLKLGTAAFESLKLI